MLKMGELHHRLLRRERRWRWMRLASSWRRVPFPYLYRSHVLPYFHIFLSFKWIVIFSSLLLSSPTIYLYIYTYMFSVMLYYRHIKVLVSWRPLTNCIFFVVCNFCFIFIEFIFVYFNSFNLDENVSIHT